MKPRSAPELKRWAPRFFLMPSGLLRHFLVASYFGLAPLLSIAVEMPCGNDGAFGIRFGDSPPPFSTRLEGSEATIWFSVTPPHPSEHFDQYRIHVDAATSRIYEIEALKRVTPEPGSLTDRLSKEEQVAGRERAKKVIADYVASLSEDLNSAYKASKYGSPTWERQTGDVIVKLYGIGPWEAWMTCTYIPAEWEIARRVVPELFQKKSSSGKP